MLPPCISWQVYYIESELWRHITRKNQKIVRSPHTLGRLNACANSVYQALPRFSRAPGTRLLSVYTWGTWLCITLLLLNRVSEAIRSNLRASEFQNFPGGACPQTSLQGRDAHAWWPYHLTNPPDAYAYLACPKGCALQCCSFVFATRSYCP